MTLGYVQFDGLSASYTVPKKYTGTPTLSKNINGPNEDRECWCFVMSRFTRWWHSENWHLGIDVGNQVGCLGFVMEQGWCTQYAAYAVWISIGSMPGKHTGIGTAPNWLQETIRYSSFWEPIVGGVRVWRDDTGEVDRSALPEPSKKQQVRSTVQSRSTNPNNESLYVDSTRHLSTPSDYLGSTLKMFPTTCSWTARVGVG